MWSVEFERLESAENIDSARAATVTSHKAWLHIESVDISVQKSRYSLFSSGRAQKAQKDELVYRKALKSQRAFEKYYKQGEGRKIDYQVNLMQVF
jgi:hypothetical protein